MRIAHRYLHWDSHTKIIKPVREILDKHNIPYTYKEDLNCVIPTFMYTIESYLYEDNPNFSKVKAELDRLHIEPQTIGTFYEDADYAKAEWFKVIAGQYQYPQPDGDFGYLECTFNLDNFCNLCDMGKIQNAPYRLKTEPKQHNSQFWGLHWVYEAIFVRQETKNILEREHIKGIRFSQPLLHKNNRVIEGFYQLHIDTILDNGFDSYNTKKITCRINNEEGCNTDPTLKCCGRVKFHHPRIGGYLFDKSILKPDHDIVRSYECFGSGGSANRVAIVSKRFKQLVDSNKLKGLSFTPIVHERLIR